MPFRPKTFFSRINPQKDVAPLMNTHNKCFHGEKNTLRKHAYSNILKISPPKKKKKILRLKTSDIFHISAQNIDCGYLGGGSNEYPQSMFLSRNKKNKLYTPVNPSFTI